jgi:hypothetical protein
MLEPCEDPLPLDELARPVRSSSNFRFDWQFYRCDAGGDLTSSSSVRDALGRIIAQPTLHEFLRASFRPLYDERFEVSPLHEHARVLCAEGNFAEVLARAAEDRLGAYSRELVPATAAGRKQVERLFGALGPYVAWELLHGEEPGCAACRDFNNHLFTTWFYGVAWDWCFLVRWPARDLLWVGCLTDTD